MNLELTDEETGAECDNRKHPTKTVMGDCQAAAARIWRSFQFEGSSCGSWEAG